MSKDAVRAVFTIDLNPIENLVLLVKSEVFGFAFELCI
jgi:hypothetical protein